MQKYLKVIFQKLMFCFLFYLCFSTVTYLAMAASDSVKVRQTVVDEGGGSGEEESGSGGIVLPVDATPPEVINFRIYDIGLSSARIAFDTDEVCVSEIYYGENRSYVSGPLTDHPDSYEISHHYVLAELEPGRKYYLKLKIRNQKGIENVITLYDFYTVPEFSQVMPDVGSLAIRQQDRRVVLSWQNPGSSDFQGVQINRRTGSPALTPAEGEKVFIGFADTFTDAAVADQTRYFYTVFAFDAANHFSSGVSVSLKTNFPGSGAGGNQNPPTDPVTPPEPAAVKDVRNLAALPDLEQKQIVLSWQYAETEEAGEVEIRRDVNFPSMSPLEGDLVYAGAGTSFSDRDVKKGQIYFYTVYVKDKSGRYSQGAIIASELKDSATAPSGSDKWEDMSFVDVKSGLLLSPDAAGKIRVLSDRVLGVNYGVENLPANLQAVAIQLDGASYLLAYDQESRSYKTSFLTPEKPGQYAFNVVFLNAENEIFFEKDMLLEVLARGQVYTLTSEKLLDSGFSWDKAWCRLGNYLGKEDTACMHEVAVAGAEVKVYKENQDGVWEVWNAKDSNQDNPFRTDMAGDYELYLPTGDYEIGVSQDGFKERRFAVSVTDDILHERILIYAKKDFKYDVLFLAILLIPIGRMALKRISHRKKH